MVCGSIFEGETEFIFAPPLVAVYCHGAYRRNSPVKFTPPPTGGCGTQLLTTGRLVNFNPQHIEKVSPRPTSEHS